MRIRGDLLLLTALLLPVARSAQASVFDELAGVRSSAMGDTHRGIGTSNDTLYLNPAGMAIGRRYAVDFNYGYSPFDNLTHLNVSAVDSKSGPVAGGVGYTRTRGDSEGAAVTLHRIYVSAAYPIMQNMAFGVTTKYVRGTLTHQGKVRNVKMYNYDVGLIIRLGQGIGLGLSAQNIIRTADTDLVRLVPLTFGGGLAWNGSPIVIGADIVVEARDSDDLQYSYHAGAEYFYMNQFPVRIGYRREPYEKRTDGTLQIENIVTGGAGWVNAGGALAFSYERSLDRPKNWSLVAAFKFFI